jgi:hypothetical protein
MGTRSPLFREILRAGFCFVKDKDVAVVTLARSQKDYSPTDRPTPQASADFKIILAFRYKKTRTRETWTRLLA